jgi:hypothetical protein
LSNRGHLFHEAEEYFRHNGTLPLQHGYSDDLSRSRLRIQ